MKLPFLNLRLLALLLLFFGRFATTAADSSNTTTTSTTTTIVPCELLVFVPFTFNETHQMDFGSDGLLASLEVDDSDHLVDESRQKQEQMPTKDSNNNIQKIKMNNLGFSQMAAAALAVHHFQTRSTDVVQNTSYIDENTGEDKCPNLEVSIRGVYDTSITRLGVASKAFLQKDLIENDYRLPAALIVGAYSDQRLGVDMETLSTGFQRPVLMHRNFKTDAASQAPYASSVYPDMVSISGSLASWLQYKGRTDYIAILYNQLGSTSIEFEHIVSLVLADLGISSRSYPYQAYRDLDDLDNSNIVKVGNVDAKGSISRAMKRLKEEGYRTIVCIMEFPDVELTSLGEAAHTMGLDTAQYFWNFVGIDASLFFYPRREIISISHIGFMVGGALIAPLEGFTHNDEDPFLTSWRNTTDPALIATINNMRRVSPNHPADYEASTDYFQQFYPAPGAGYMYDSVMTAILGACDGVSAMSGIDLNRTDMNNSTIMAQSDILARLHLNAIRQVAFSGATSESIQMSNISQGSVHPSSPTYGVINMFYFLGGKDESEWYDLLTTELPNSTSHLLFKISDRLDSSKSLNGSWEELKPFVFRSGETTPPPYLRHVPEQNFLSRSSRIIGLTLMGIVMAGCVASAVWLVMNRQSRTVRASQLPLMLCICGGSFVESSAVIFVSVDESYGWTQEGLNKACSAVPWLFVLGHCFTYSSLFAKLWRLNKLLQFRRTTVSIRSVAWPTALITAVALGTLIAMQVMSPLRWVRTVTDEVTGESFGACESEHFERFILIVAGIMLIPHGLVGYMAYKTMDVDEQFSESYWIFILIALQLEVILLSLPSVLLIRDSLTTIRYFGVVTMIVIFPGSTMALLTIPKVLAHRRLTKGAATAGARAVAKGNIVVTGLPTTTNENVTSEAIGSEHLQDVHTAS